MFFILSSMLSQVYPTLPSISMSMRRFSSTSIPSGRLSEFVDESVDCEAHGFAFKETSLHHVKDLLGADFGYTSFVLDRIVLPARCDGRVGVGPAIRVDQRDTLGIVLQFLRCLGM